MDHKPPCHFQVELCHYDSQRRTNPLVQRRGHWPRRWGKTQACVLGALDVLQPCLNFVAIIFIDYLNSASKSMTFLCSPSIKELWSLMHSIPNHLSFHVSSWIWLYAFASNRDSILYFIVGVLYGTTSVMVGHPFDTIKTKMQAQRGFEKGGMAQTFLKTIRTQGPIGLYR